MSYQPHRIVGLRAPLFDLLVDTAPEETKEISPPRFHGHDALRFSIARDLQRLLNSRRANRVALDPSTATVLDYGVPDFSYLSAASVSDRRVLAEMVRSAITAFEPRLQEVVVVVEPSPESPSEAWGRISCKARLGSYIEPVTFSLVLNCGEGDVQILEAASARSQEVRHGR